MSQNVKRASFRNLSALLGGLPVDAGVPRRRRPLGVGECAVAARTISDTEGLGDACARVTLLGPFSIELGERSAGPWYRPPAKRLCELVMVSPEFRVGREVARELLFADLAPASSANALSRALSLAREALSALGEEVAGWLRADRAHIWFSADAALDVDLTAHEKALRSALAMEPGGPRDAALSTALAEDGALLEDEPYAEWALRPREALELVRQRARLELARDRARRRGHSAPEAVIEAWEACLAHDPACEEAASSLMRVYSARGQSQAVSVTYERCRAALEALGLRASPALEQAQRATMPQALRSAPAGTGPPAPHRRLKEERRLVSVLFTELSGPVGMGRRLDPEDLRQVVGEALAAMISEVEGLGGTVTAVSGAGLAAVFGAPEAHEDDPDRAVRAGGRILSAIGAGGLPPGPGALSVRAGIETGPAVVGPLGAGAGYGAMGEVVGLAAALQSAAKAGSVLVGPVTRAAAEAAFEWGPTEDVVPTPGAKPLVASYLERPKARSLGYRGQRRWAGSAAVVGRDMELAVLDEVVRETTSGTGSVVSIVGEPGLGKTRLVHECRKRFMAWVGAGTGRLPLWLEGRAASYASSTPYGLYQQLLSAWVGIAPEEGEELVRPALERAMKAIFGGQVDHARFLAHMMGLPPGLEEARLARLSPEGLQRATFAAVRAVVGRLVERGPTVLVLEDLHWADPISIRLTEELPALAADGPLLILLTRRLEPDPGLSGLESALEADARYLLRQVKLSPLPEEAERALARSLIGVGADEGVIEAMCVGVDGNPLFLEERLSSMIETGALVKEEDAAWRLRGSAGTEVPEALERLIRSRVDRLGAQPGEIITAASVLGREFGLSLLTAVAEVKGELATALAELCASGLLTEVRKVPEPAYRFRHALIQDAIYGGLLRSERRQFHARAAWGLEAASPDRVEELAPVLGHHYAAAGEADQAVYYLEVAGDHAASVFAMDEAVASYREALAILDEGRTIGTVAKAAVELRAKLAEVLWRHRRFGQARVVLREALQLVGPEQPLQAARLQARLGRVEAEASMSTGASTRTRATVCYNAAIGAFDAAEHLLGECTEELDEEQSDLWLEIQVDGRANLHYWWNEPEREAEVLAKARPVLEARGSPTRKAGFYQHVANQRAWESRHRIDEEMLENARTAVSAAKEGNNEYDFAVTVMNLGLLLLWHGDLAEAQEKLEASRVIWERIGDPLFPLGYLNLAALRRHDVETVRSLSGQVLTLAEAAEHPNPVHLILAKATMAWVAWRDGRPADVVAIANEALELWEVTAVSYPCKMLCLWPLIAVHLSAGQVAEAVDAGRQLLMPPQIRFPDELESLVEWVVATWDSGERDRAAGKLADALELAERLGYA
jgi:class 3 adenylate cyclase/tetratricopeptide (TPR) repeat protein